MTLGAAAARVRLIVWCRECQHQVEPDPAEMAQRYGAETPVLHWRERLICSRRGGRQVDIVVSGASSASEMRPRPLLPPLPSTPVTREWGGESPLVRTSLHGLPRYPRVDCPT